MRRAAGDLKVRLAAAVALVALVALGAIGAAPAGAEGPSAGLARSARDLDGIQVLADEPIWICDPGAPPPARPWSGVPPVGQLVGAAAAGDSIAPEPHASSFGEPPPRAGDLVRSVWIPPARDRHPLESGVWGGGGLEAGAYELRSSSGRLARIRVVPPRGSEVSVRAALARAARLSRDESDPAAQAQAARLYEAVLERYPNTAYATAIWAGLWRVRASTTRFADDPGAWLEPVFANFHNACFGVWALDRFMADVPPAEARPILRRLVGLYPDTRIARAAAAYP